MARAKPQPQPTETAESCLIRYTGAPHRRIVDGIEWNEANGWTVAIGDANLVERLLNNGDFEIVPVEPVESEKDL